MTQQPTTEQRLANLEQDVTELKKLLGGKIAEFELKQHAQEDINGALLVRIDSFIGDLHRIERDQKRGFAELRAGQKELETEQKQIVTRLEVIETNNKVLIEAAREQKQAIDDLREGQRGLQTGLLVVQESVDQIVAILTNKAKTND